MLQYNLKNKNKNGLHIPASASCHFHDQPSSPTFPNLSTSIWLTKIADC